MRIVLTGAAGFIGSHLAESLLDQGHTVVGVDSFTDYYDVFIKRRNAQLLIGRDRFELVELDLATADLTALVQGADALVHLAGQPGVRLSWASHFETYVQRNIVTTQRLLEQLRKRPEVPFLFASSSSVYGDAARYPSHEADQLRPISPYGVTKSAAESLTYSYATTFNLSAVALRFFTVYGPRQRPDMATQRLAEAALTGGRFTLFGDGTQLRDFTYVTDICRAIATLLDGRQIPTGMTPLNLGGDSETSMLQLIEFVENSAGASIDISFGPQQSGDVKRTGADVSAARRWLDWYPQVSVAEGVAAQVAAAREALGR